MSRLSLRSLVSRDRTRSPRPRPAGKHASRRRLPLFDHFEERTLLSQLSGAIWTTDYTGSIVNQNIYASRDQVFLNGGPGNGQNNNLPDGHYYFQVTDPSGATLLSTDPAEDRQLTVTNGLVSGPAPGTHLSGHDYGLTLPGNPTDGSISTVQLAPFDPTPNSGGEYKAWLIAQTDTTQVSADGIHLIFKLDDVKTDNFKVGTNNGATPSISTDQNPKIVTLPDTKVLTDTATVTGGQNPTGTVTFTLFSPSGTIVDNETVQLGSDGKAVTQSGYMLPTDSSTVVTGTYQWIATYNGDPNNNAVSSNIGDEPVTVNPASPTLVTKASPNGPITLGTTAPTLSDSADLEGGYNPTGSITFTLKYNGSQVYTHTVTVNGNAVYGSGGYTLPTSGTVTGSYVWSASYSGDGNNNTASDDGTSALEQVTVNPAQPSIVTTPGGTVAAGTTQKMSDSATLSGGYYETGSITFTLYSPSNTVVDTETVTVSGNGIYTTPTGYSPPSTAAAGTYYWVATYNGDGNNLTAASGRYDEPEVVQNGKTLGFYSNSNGQAALTGSKTGTTLLANIYNQLFGLAGVSYGGQTPSVNGVLVKDTTNSVLVDANGNPLKLSYFQKYANVDSFLLNATATNMANMLSAQLLTTEFNVVLGYVNPTVSIQVSKVTIPTTGAFMSSTLQHALTAKPTGATYWTQITTSDGGAAGIQSILNSAIASLKAAPKTISASGDRTYQEALKDCLDGINNNEPIFI